MISPVVSLERELVGVERVLGLRLELVGALVRRQKIFSSTRARVLGERLLDRSLSAAQVASAWPRRLLSRTTQLGGALQVLRLQEAVASPASRPGALRGRSSRRARACLAGRRGCAGCPRGRRAGPRSACPRRSPGGPAEGRPRRGFPSSRAGCASTEARVFEPAPVSEEGTHEYSLSRCGRPVRPGSARLLGAGQLPQLQGLNRCTSGRSRIVSTPGRAARTLGMLLTTIAAVARSPATPPVIVMSMGGVPSIRRGRAATRRPRTSAGPG